MDWRQYAKNDESLADLCGLSPKQRAKSIVLNCARTDFRPALLNYDTRARRQTFDSGQLDTVSDSG